MITIALPKGRLGDKAYDLFAAISYDCEEIKQDNRKLVFENKEKGVKYILVKPADVAIYVEKGAADLGVVGKDVLSESSPDVYELTDLGFGKCALAVAAPKGWQENLSAPLRIATKYPNVAHKFYSDKSRSIEIIKLNGSIELAPLLKISDVIVDIVESGKTLEENGLYVHEQILPCSARLIANKASYSFLSEEINSILSNLHNGDSI